MIKLIRVIRVKYFDNTVDLSKLSKTFLLWGAGLVLVYISNIILIRLIGMQQYGEYAVFMNWVGLISTGVTFGWDGYLVQQVPLLPVNSSGKKEGAKILKRALFTFFVLYSLLLLLLFLGVYFFKIISFFHTTGAVLSFLLLVLFFTGISYSKSILKIFHRISPVQWLEDICKPLLLMGVFYWYYYFGREMTLSSVYHINILLFLGLLVGLYWLLHKTIRNQFDKKEQGSVEKGWLHKCFYFMCIMLGYSFFSRMELLFLGYYDKNEDAAKYQLLLRLAELVILPDFLFNYYLPQKFSHLFAEKNNAEAGKLFRNAARTIFFLQLLCLTAVASLGYFYLQSFNIAGWRLYVLLLVLSSAQLLYSFFGSSNLVLMTSGNERYSFLALALVIVAEAIANVLFIPSLGLMAAVYISWGSILLYTLLLYIFVKKKLQFSSPFL